MTPGARAFILRCFCRKHTASETAYCVNKLFDLDRKVDAEAVRKIWNAERQSNVAMRQLEERFGERPTRGFPQCEHTRLAEQLVAL